MQSINADMLICPVNAHAATKISNVEHLAGQSHYSFMCNICDLPTGVIPFTVVKDGEDSGYTDHHNDRITRMIAEDMQGTVGLPLGIQVIGLPYQDEKLLGVMKRMDDARKFRPVPKLIAKDVE